MAKFFEYAILDEKRFYCGGSSVLSDKRFFKPYIGEEQSFVAFLNEIGLDGWELVNAIDDNYYFKREITAEDIQKRREKEEARLKAMEEERKVNMTDLDKAYQYIENISQAQKNIGTLCLCSAIEKRRNYT